MRRYVVIGMLAVLVATGRSYGQAPGRYSTRVFPAAKATAVPPAKFARQPTAVKDGNSVRIEFALNRSTDVAVYIEDANGGIVRHLAAGMLGKNAPAPLARGKLAQSITWDRKDDRGRPVPAGKYRVRVGAGLKASYAGTAFTKRTGPDNITGEVMGLAAGPDGRVYVLSRRWRSGHWAASAVHVFRRDGAYERTIKPFPSDVPPDRLKGINALTAADGRALPIIHRVVAMSFYPWEDLAQQMAVTPDGQLQMVVVGAGYTKQPRQYLAALDGKTGAPYEGYPGQPLLGAAGIRHLHLAPASDGRSVYLTGLDAYNSGFGNRKVNPPLVLKVGLPKRGQATVFFGNVKTAGNDQTHLDDPRGIATDGRGRLFVADRGNNRIVVISEKSGRFLSAIPVPSPGWVGVHRGSGAVYVQSQGAVIKFSGGKSPRELARLRLPAVPARERGRVRWSFALDAEAPPDGARPAVLWVGRNRGGTALMRCVDQGDRFSPLRQAGYHPSRRLWNISVGQQRREIACKVGWRALRILDERTGRSRDLRLAGSAGQTFRLGPNGQIYGMDHWKHGIRRWDRNGKYMPFPATAGHAALKGRLPSRPTGTTSWERDFCVDWNGNVYVKHSGKHYHGRMRVDVYDRNGRFLRTVIWVVSDGAFGPRVDLQGNVYIAESIKPFRKRRPAFFDNRLPTLMSSRQYTWMYGSIIKFGPPGGAIWFPITNRVDEYGFDGEAKLAPGLRKERVSSIRNGRLIRTPAELQGALWWRFGCSYVLDMHVSHNRRCHCTATEFDVDDFGRVFYPDQGRFRVVVLDTNGNEILAFGRYGNQDSLGPEIPIAWMVGLGVSDRHVYVADGLNRRVLRVRLSYECDTTVAVP